MHGPRAARMPEFVELRRLRRLHRRLLQLQASPDDSQLRRRLVKRFDGHHSMHPTCMAFRCTPPVTVETVGDLANTRPTSMRATNVWFGGWFLICKQLVRRVIFRIPITKSDPWAQEGKALGNGTPMLSCLWQAVGMSVNTRSHHRVPCTNHSSNITGAAPKRIRFACRLHPCT